MSGHVDLTLRCPTCGRRADMCFDHGDQWKKRSQDRQVAKMTEHELRAGVNEFTEDDPPPYKWRGVYPGMCINPETCRGYTACPRNRSCCE